MHALTGPLLDVVRRLDALRPAPTLVGIAEVLQQAALRPEDVAEYVRNDPDHYHRSLVILREQYELLVMTWLPGQESDPHDHAGSICVLQVLEGAAVEAAFRLAPDGYVEQDYEQPLERGAISAGEDIGIHTIRNPMSATGPLVSVHVYSPPLSNFRRFRRRPTETAPRVLPHEPQTIAIVGGGFSGAMTAAQVIRRASMDHVERNGAPLRVVLIERRGAVGEGIAYGTREPHHLLNVPAGRMSAWPDRPTDFLNWAQERAPQTKPTDFVSREWYGQYIRETLLSEARLASQEIKLDILLDEVRRVARRPEGGWLIHLGRGESLKADVAVLAIGHRPPSDPLARMWTGTRTRWIADPWRPFAVNVIEPDQPVLILGAGLTAVDAVLTLCKEPRTAPITLLSRRGLLPQSHAAKPVAPTDLAPLVNELLAQEDGVRALQLSRRLRRAVAEAAAKGVDWRSVVDGVRPFTAQLWQALPLAEQRKFVARLRPYWEVHRHRMALGIGERFGELRDCGWVDVVSGRVIAVHGEGNSVNVSIARRDDSVMENTYSWVLNCTGPAPSNSAAANPAIGALLVDGSLRVDPLGLGFDTSDRGAAIDQHAAEVNDLFLVGTLRKARYWESTAVPELRTQAAGVAAAALAELQKQLRGASDLPHI